MRANENEIDGIIVADESGSITELFHRVNSVLPIDQELITVRPEATVYEALDLLRKHTISQMPVSVGRQCLGLFSYRSFAQALMKLNNDGKDEGFNPQEMLVEDCIEQPTYAHVTDELRNWFDSIDRQDAILVGEPSRLQGIVTAMDILRYLYAVASPFVLLAEIELSLRALITLAVKPDELEACARRCLKRYAANRVPTNLESMTFGDYVSIVGDEESWGYFEPIFKGNRMRTRAKLDQIRVLRNDIFHFRREITVEEYEDLTALRNWMLLKSTVAESREEGGAL